MTKLVHTGRLSSQRLWNTPTKKEPNAFIIDHIFEHYCRRRFILVVLSKVIESVKIPDKAFSEPLLIKYHVEGYAVVRWSYVDF